MNKYTNLFHKYHVKFNHIKYCLKSRKRTVIKHYAWIERIEPSTGAMNISMGLQSYFWWVGRNIVISSDCIISGLFSNAAFNCGEPSLK